MSPAWLEIRAQTPRFVIIVLGLMFIQLAALGMLGFYRGLVRDMLVIVDGIGADFWIVQGGRTGPFAEISILPPQVDRRAETVPGVVLARQFIQFPRMVEIDGTVRRVGITGLDYPKDRGDWIPLLAGRALASGHFEAIVDRRTGLAVGDRLRLGMDDYTVVGVAEDQVDLTFDPVIFVSVADAVAIGSTVTSETALLNRASGGQPQNYDVSSVLVTVADWADPDAVAARIARWPDVAIVPTAQQRAWIVDDMLGPLRRQILYFTVLLLAVTGTILGLTVHGAVLQKTHFIALIKLLGASRLFVVRHVLAQSCLVGAVSLALAVVMAALLFPAFPRTVLLTAPDVAAFAGALALVCVLASLSGIRTAMRIQARAALG